MRRVAIVASVFLLVGPGIHGRAAARQIPAQPESTTVPLEIMIEDLYAAYARPTAEEMTIKLRGPQGPERAETVAVRIDPGDGRGKRPRRVSLDLGPLRVYASQGRLTAISSLAPGRYFQCPYQGELTPATLASILPPIPLPQLELASQERMTFPNPTPYTTNVVWSGASAQSTTRPPTMTLTGSGPSGPVTLVANLTTARLLRLSATIHGPAGDTTLELSCRVQEPGDPESWPIAIEGREPVASLSELRLAPPKPKGPVQPGQAVPDMSFSRTDLSAWTLHAAFDVGPLPNAPAPVLALVLFRGYPAPERAAASMEDARTGIDALRSIRRETPGPELVGFSAGAAIVIELGEFSRAKWDAAARAWASKAPGPDPLFTADELMWASSGAQSIDRFLPDAGAVVVVIGPDKVLRGVVALDGRARDRSGLDAEIRAILKSGPGSAEPPAAKQEPRP